ncbi:MAG: proline--tRNA ligase [Chlamydiae bacterium]|nr:proline--tRNA ligase [Chlamydiota bacterium]
MSSKKKTAISPTREEDYSEWYQQVIKEADLAEHSPVRGCMVIKPWGYGIWENIQKVLDEKFKETGHQNAYFPLFIPVSFLEKEAKHVEGFAKECAVVTHHRLEKKGDKLVPAGELDEPLVIRPTSEMIIGEMFSKWVHSYRDLPILINQWANIVRWEMRTRMFLRTTEFLWQEGHTAHATKEEALEETLKMLDVYADFAKNYLAIPVIKGQKSEGEKFPGADTTYCIEAMMQDKKALQGGTSHFLGQNFSKSCNIKFADIDGKETFCWTSSWGVTTRLIGALIMVHSDDDGLILPPRISPTHIVILPVVHKEDVAGEVASYCENLKSELTKINYFGRPLQVFIDKREIRGGEKKWQWIKKGIPLILEVGPRDIKEEALFVTRRDDKSSKSVKRSVFLETLVEELDSIQSALLLRATKFRDENIKEIKTKEEFYAFFTPENKEKPEIHGGFAKAYFCMDAKIEEKLKEDLNVTVRCIPLDHEDKEGICIFSKNKAARQVIFAKAY